MIFTNHTLIVHNSDMKAVIQRVSKARVTDESGECREIGRGLLVLLGIAQGDETEDAEFLLDKILGLRIFEDDRGKLNLSLLDVAGDLMLISQFTLLADTKKGRRPSFHLAGDPQKSRELFLRFVELARARVKTVEAGWFGNKMQVELVNDGPVTIILER